MGADCEKGGQQQDAEELLGLYLDALDEELVGLHTCISTHDYTVRQLFFVLSLR
jgi:hypothetical protein